jgi:hypothetical protein
MMCLMRAGNVLALLQTNLKRVLAYSSIAYLGYARVAFLVGEPFAIEAVRVYLVADSIMTMGACSVITLLPSSNCAPDADLIEECRGLFRTRPALSLAFAASLLSLAGILRLIVRYGLTGRGRSDRTGNAGRRTPAGHGAGARSCRARGPGLAAHRPGRLPHAAPDPDPRDRLQGGALTHGDLQIFHGLR